MAFSTAIAQQFKRSTVGMTLKKGAAKGDGKLRDLDYFRPHFSNPGLAELYLDEFRTVYGDEPKSIVGYLAYDDIDESATSNFMGYGAANGAQYMKSKCDLDEGFIIARRENASARLQYIERYIGGELNSCAKCCRFYDEEGKPRENPIAPGQLAPCGARQITRVLLRLSNPELAHWPFLVAVQSTSYFDYKNLVAGFSSIMSDLSEIQQGIPGNADIPLSLSSIPIMIYREDQQVEMAKRFKQGGKLVVNRDSVRRETKSLLKVRIEPTFQGELQKLITRARQLKQKTMLSYVSGAIDDGYRMIEKGNVPQSSFHQSSMQSIQGYDPDNIPFDDDEYIEVEIDDAPPVEVKAESSQERIIQLINSDSELSAHLKETLPACSNLDEWASVKDYVESHPEYGDDQDAYNFWLSKTRVKLEEQQASKQEEPPTIAPNLPQPPMVEVPEVESAIVPAVIQEEEPDMSEPSTSDDFDLDDIEI